MFDIIALLAFLWLYNSVIFEENASFEENLDKRIALHI